MLFSRFVWRQPEGNVFLLHLIKLTRPGPGILLCFPPWTERNLSWDKPVVNVLLKSSSAQLTLCSRWKSKQKPGLWSLAASWLAFLHFTFSSVQYKGLYIIIITCMKHGSLPLQDPGLNQSTSAIMFPLPWRPKYLDPLQSQISTWPWCTGRETRLCVCSQNLKNMPSSF